MEEIEENVIIKSSKSNKKKTIDISIWRLFAYFIIYSFIGYIIETIFAIITTGKIESRQSFLYGPFCAIYGVGAVIMIVVLHFFKKNNYRLFLGGFFVGSVIEYIISLVGEIIFHTIWWDYSDMPLNINGRICLYYSIFWGVLAIFLVRTINPRVEKFINFIKSKITIKKLKVVTLTAVILLFIDWVVSSVALDLFVVRKVHDHNLNVYKKEQYLEKYDYIYSNEKIRNLIYTFWNDEKMIKSQPNIKIQEVDGKIIYFSELMPNIQPYYYKIDMTWKDNITNNIFGNKQEN